MAKRTFGQQDLASHTGLALWQLTAARRQGLVPEGKHGRWTQEAADRIAADARKVRKELGDKPPVWSGDAAAILAARTRTDVTREDVDVLAATGQLPVAAVSTNGHNHFCPAQLGRVPLKVVRRAVADRLAGRPALFSTWAAVGRLGWRYAEFAKITKVRGLSKGPGNMWLRADIDALAADAELNAALEAVRLLGANEAAARLGVRRSDWDLIVAAGWVATAGMFEVESPRVGYTHTLTVPGYLAADIDQVLELPDVDWAALRATGPRQRSPLAARIQRPKRAGDAIRQFCRDVEAARGIRAWTTYKPRREQWVLNWTLDEALQPTADAMGKLLDDAPDVAPHRARVDLLTLRWATVHWAQRMLQPGTAIVLDTETTDLPGAICEIACIDAASGETLLNTLVNPRQRISPGARAVHGISDEAVADAPIWADVSPQFIDAIGGRIVLAYNVSFDEGVIRADTRRAGLSAKLLPERWECIMQANSDWWHYSGRIPLDAGHRALGDAQAARAVLWSIAQTRPPART